MIDLPALLTLAGNARALADAAPSSPWWNSVFACAALTHVPALADAVTALVAEVKRLEAANVHIQDLSYGDGT